MAYLCNAVDLETAQHGQVSHPEKLRMAL
jgi:hypothetical protein